MIKLLLASILQEKVIDARQRGLAVQGDEQMRVEAGSYQGLGLWLGLDKDPVPHPDFRRVVDKHFGHLFDAWVSHDGSS